MGERSAFTVTVSSRMLSGTALHANPPRVARRSAHVGQKCVVMVLGSGGPSTGNAFRTSSSRAAASRWSTSGSTCCVTVRCVPHPAVFRPLQSHPHSPQQETCCCFQHRLARHLLPRALGKLVRTTFGPWQALVHRIVRHHGGQHHLF